MEQTAGLRAGLYERVSDPRKARGSREARSVVQQNARNREACEQHRWTITVRYKDPGVSASRYARQKRRAEYERLRADVTDGRVDVLVFWMVNRADRKLGEWSNLLDECRERGVKIYITSSQRLFDVTNASDWRHLASEGVAAAVDSDVISTNVRNGMAANLADGKPHGPTPWGWVRLYDEDREMTAQVPHPERGPIRSGIIRRVAAGDSYAAIRRDLRQQGILAPRGGEWTDIGLRHLVLSPVNVAKRRYDPDRSGLGVLTDGADWWEPLIDEVTWRQACKRVLDATRDSPRPGIEGHQHLLSYLAACGKCMGPERYRPGAETSPKRHGHPLYVCKDKGCASIVAPWLDEFITELAILRMSKPDFYAQISSTAESAEAQAARADAGKMRAHLAANLKLNAAMRITAEAYAELEAEMLPKIRAAEQRADELSVPPQLLAFASPGDDIRDRWEHATVATRKGVVRALFDHIHVLPAAGRGRRGSFDPGRVDWDWRRPGE